MMPTVAVLVACHNRRAKTLACLTSLQAQTARVRLAPIVFDDGSQDGTADAVQALMPETTLIAGNGHAYWAGGMRQAFDHALAGDPDFVLWLNDDVVLAPDALARLIATHDGLVAEGQVLTLVGGALADPRSRRTSYHGVIRTSRWHPLRFGRCEPDAAAPRRCDTLHGNVVLVPRATARAVGSIGAAYRHTLGDLDYGLRVARAGGWVGLAPGHLGWCSLNEGGVRWFNADLALRARWRLVGTPLGFPLRPWLAFVRAHGGPLWPLLLPLPYWRLLVPKRIAAAVGRWRAPHATASPGGRHAPAS